MSDEVIFKIGDRVTHNKEITVLFAIDVTAGTIISISTDSASNISFMLVLWDNGMQFFENKETLRIISEEEYAQLLMER